MEFWQKKGLNEFSPDEWEAICDGCGRCCMWKFEDEDSGEILYTDIACRLFDDETCRCTKYAERRRLVPDCMDIRSFTAAQYAWLPESCAYRLLFEGKPLFDWHPLVSGDKRSVHIAGISMHDRTTSAAGLSEEDMIAHIIDPDGADAQG